MLSMPQLTEIVASSGFVDDMSKFDSAQTFKDNDIDSLDVMTLLLQVEEAAKVKFSDEDFDRIRSLDDVKAVLDSKK